MLKKSIDSLREEIIELRVEIKCDTRYNLSQGQKLRQKNDEKTKVLGQKLLELGKKPFVYGDDRGLYHKIFTDQQEHYLMQNTLS